MIKHCQGLQQQIVTTNKVVMERMDEISCNLVGLLDLSNAIMQLHAEWGMRRMARSVYEELYSVMQVIATDDRLYEALLHESRERGDASDAEEVSTRMSFMQGFKDAKGMLSLDEPTKVYASKPTMRNLFQLMHARMSVARGQGYKSYAHMSMQRHCMFKEPEKAIGFIMDTLRKVKFEDRCWKKEEG